MYMLFAIPAASFAAILFVSLSNAFSSTTNL